MADPENFGGGGFEAKTSKIRMSSPKLRLIFWPKSEIQTFFSPKIRWSPKKKKKKKKRSSDFSAGFVTFRSVGGDASRNGAELFKIRADFLAKIVTFRLVGGMHPPLNPPLGLPPPNRNASSDKIVTKKSILSSVSISCFVCILTAASEDLFFVFGLHLNFGTNTALQSVNIFFYFFWSSS